MRVWWIARIHELPSAFVTAQLEAVFDPFYRVEASRSRDTGGTGLGLTIARNIARRCGGDLVLRNIPTGGLEAVFTLPVSA